MFTYNNKEISTLLFDGDGTLVDTYEVILTSMRYTLNTVYGKNFSNKELMAGVGTPLYDQILAFANNDETKANELMEIYRDHNDAILREGVKAFPDVPTSLKRLQSAGYTLGVVTSKRHAPAQLGLELADIAEYFSVLIGSDDWPEHKPNPGPILRACELLGVSPHDCLYIGDSPFDIQAGNAAGCATVAALWGMFSEEELQRERPTFCCSSMKACADMLLE